MHKREKTYTPSRGRFAGRTFKSRHAYRNAMAREKGFKNYYEERKSYQSVSSLKKLRTKSIIVQQKRADALEVLSIMRRTQSNLSPAIRIFNRENSGTPITLPTVKKYIKPAIKKQKGRWIAKDRDRLVRAMRFLTKRGTDFIEIRDSRSASRVGEYWNAIDEFVMTGETNQLNQFKHKYVQSGKIQYRFITDPDEIMKFADFGELRFETIYQEITANR